jgi:hypothetical protein
MAIVHSHSPSVVSFSLVGEFRFRPACHMCGFLGNGAENVDIRDVDGDSLCEPYVGAPRAHSRAGPFWQTVRSHGAGSRSSRGAGVARCLYACVRFTTSRPCEITASGFFQFCTVSVGSFCNSTMSAHLPSPIAPMSSRCR